MGKQGKRSKRTAIIIVVILSISQFIGGCKHNNNDQGIYEEILLVQKDIDDRMVCRIVLIAREGDTVKQVHFVARVNYYPGMPIDDLYKLARYGETGIQKRSTIKLNILGFHVDPSTQYPTFYYPINAFDRVEDVWDFTTSICLFVGTNADYATSLLPIPESHRYIFFVDYRMGAMGRYIVDYDTERCFFHSFKVFDKSTNEQVCEMKVMSARKVDKEYFYKKMSEAKFVYSAIRPSIFGLTDE